MSQSIPANQKVIGRYTILRELRRDRHSVSYAAVDPVMNRELVVKAVQIVPAGPPMRAEARRRIEQAFVRQAQAAGRLHHPNILTVFDAGLGHEFGYLVIERVAGRSLQDLLGSGVKFSDLQCAGIGARVADALEYAHGQGVAHGQLGPQHVYILADGSPKLSGFGGWIDAGGEGDDALTRTEQFLPYFQNEVTEDTRRRDLRSVASLLCTMIQARPHAVTVSNPDAAVGATQRPSAIPAFSALLSDALDPKSLTAPKTAAELRDALIAFVWAERSNRPATSTLGVSLSASISAEAAPAQPQAPAAPRAAAERPDLMALALERLNESLQSARARLKRIRPWAWQHRLALSLAGALLVAGLVLGNLLVQLRPAQVAVPADPGASSTADPAGGSGADRAAASPVASTAGPASGTVVFRIDPWGEILIDDKPTGVSPPLVQMALASGTHRIEVRHGSDTPWIVQINVEAAVPVTVSHRFP